MVVVDAEGRILRWNKASEEMWGISDEAAAGQSYAHLIGGLGMPPEEAERLEALVRQVNETVTPYQAFKVAMRTRRRGETFANILLSPLIDRQGERQGVVLIMEDVTREVRMEAEMARIRRLADIGQLAAKMAHEVRNPLSSIKGAAQLMRNEYENLAPLREFLDIIVDEVNGLSKITTDLLDFARPMRLDLHYTDMNELTERTLQFQTAYLRDRHIAVTFTPDTPMPPILGDPKQIQQVIRNILFNAVQAMPDGGEMTVTTSYNTADQSVTLRFTDTGVGIPSDKTEEIFQPFYTTKTKGTGLGLAIVRRIVDNHGGHVEVTSRVGEGTCFSITFPMRPMVSALPESGRILEPPPVPPSLPDA